MLSNTYIEFQMSRYFAAHYRLLTLMPPSSSLSILLYILQPQFPVALSPSPYTCHLGPWPTDFLALFSLLQGIWKPRRSPSSSTILHSKTKAVEEDVEVKGMHRSPDIVSSCSCRDINTSQGYRPLWKQDTFLLLGRHLCSAQLHWSILR